MEISYPHTCIKVSDTTTLFDCIVCLQPRKPENLSVIWCDNNCHPPFVYTDQVNDLSGSIGMLPAQLSPPTGHSTPHQYHHPPIRHTDSPISPLQETPDMTGPSEHE